MSEFSWLIDDSNKDIMTNMYCYVCRKAGPDIADKTDFVTGKKLKREIIVYHNKTKSLKYENCLNVVSEKAHSSNKLVSIFCLIQGIYNYSAPSVYHPPFYRQPRLSPKFSSVPISPIKNTPLYCQTQLPPSATGFQTQKS